MKPTDASIVAVDGDTVAIDSVDSIPNKLTINYEVQQFSVLIFHLEAVIGTNPNNEK